MDAGHRLLRILIVGFIFHFSVFLRNGQDTHGRVGFERVCRLRVHHENAHISVIATIDQTRKRYGRNQYSLYENGCFHQSVYARPGRPDELIPENDLGVCRSVLPAQVAVDCGNSAA